MFILNKKEIFFKSKMMRKVIYMNFFTKLFKSRDKPINFISSHWPFLWGQTTSGRAVNDRTAMQVTAVYACVRVLAEAVAGLPLNVYQYRPDGSKEAAVQYDECRVLDECPEGSGTWLCRQYSV